MRHDQRADGTVAVDGAGSRTTHARACQCARSATFYPRSASRAHGRDPRLDLIGKGATDLTMANLANLIAHRLPELRALFGLAQIMLLGGDGPQAVNQ
jgi:hypothetical protein